MTGRPPDAPRHNEKPDPVVQTVLTAALVLLALGFVWLTVKAGESFLAPLPPIATPSAPAAQAIVFPTADPILRIVYAAQATWYAPTPRPTATPEPTPDLTPNPDLTPHAIVLCGRGAVRGQPCAVPFPPSPTPTPLSDCPPDLTRATPASECIYQGRP